MSNDKSFEGYGRFMVTWARLNTVLDTAIIKESGMRVSHGVLLVNCLNYKSRLGVLRGLLEQAGGEKRDVVPLLNEIAQDAKRLPMVQGSAALHPDGGLTFFRTDASAKLSGTVAHLSADEMVEEADTLTTKVDALATALGITPDELAEFESITSDTLVKRRKEPEATPEAAA